MASSSLPPSALSLGLPPSSPPSAFRLPPFPRVVHVVPWDLTVGGMQRMLDLWCERQADDWEVHIASQGARGPFGFRGATVHAPVNAREAKTLLASIEPDLLIHHGPHTGYARYAACPVVWAVHGMRVLGEPAPTWCKPAAVFSNIRPRGLHPTWASLAFHALPIGVDLDLYRPRPRPLVAAIAGRLAPEKVPPDFVHALAAWSDRGTWRVRFVGTGLENTYQTWVRRQLAGLEWVDFQADVEPARMPAVYQSIDALVVPTDAAWGETGCYSAVEAMASGVPVVARDCEGLRWSCRPVDVGGALYAAGDRELLALLRRLDDPGARAELGRRGRRVAEALHDLDDDLAARDRLLQGLKAESGKLKAESEEEDSISLTERVFGRPSPASSTASVSAALSPARSSPPSGKLRVAICTPALYWGGAERVLLDLARFSADRLEWVGCATVSRIFRDDTMVDLFRALMPVCEAGREAVQRVLQNADVLLAWGAYDLGALVRPFGGRVVFIGHGSGTFDRNAARQSCPGATHYVAVAEAALPPFLETGIAKEAVTVIHNGIDPARCAQTRHRDEVRAMMGVGPDDFLVGYLGRMVPEKNPAGVARAVALLPARFKAAFVGGGWDLANQRAAVAGILGERALFVDRIEDVGNYLAAFDVFGLASPAEGFSMAMLEAMLREVPCVLTDVGVLPELERRHGRRWESIPPQHEPRQFADAIVRIAGMTRRDLADRIGAARRIVEENYMAEQMAARWIDYLRGIVNHTEIREE